MNAFVQVIRRELSSDPILGVEVGVSKGETSAALLAAFPKLRLVMVDAWATYPENHPYRKSGDGHSKLTAEQQAEHKRLALEATEFAADRRVVIHATSLQASWHVDDGQLDFCIIDGDHTFYAVAMDLRLWWPKVRPEGLLLGHDWDHPRNFKKGGLFGVNKAVTQFTKETGLRLDNQGDVWWCSKRASNC